MRAARLARVEAERETFEESWTRWCVRLRELGWDGEMSSDTVPELPGRRWTVEAKRRRGGGSGTRASDSWILTESQMKSMRHADLVLAVDYEKRRMMEAVLETVEAYERRAGRA